jgi:hypothetical protein
MCINWFFDITNTYQKKFGARIFYLLRSPGIHSKETIQQAYVGLSYRPATQRRPAESIPGLLKKFTNSGSVHGYLTMQCVKYCRFNTWTN